MKSRRQRIIEDIGFTIAGPIAVAVGALIQENNIAYPAGDPRGEPWYGTAVLAIAVLIGAVLFLVGVVRLVIDVRASDARID